jgi:hypothetical protein
MFHIEKLWSDLKAKSIQGLRLLDSNEGYLYLNWGMRMAALIALVAYFVYRRADFVSTELTRIRPAGFLFVQRLERVPGGPPSGVVHARLDQDGPVLF